MRGSAASHSATIFALSTCACIRNGSVSTPRASRKAECGESDGPMSRSCSARRRGGGGGGGGPDVAQLLGAKAGEEAVLAEVAVPVESAVVRHLLVEERE